jgi:hypothetical protein
MPEPEGDSRGWEGYRRLILSELERINGSIHGINEKIERFRQEDISNLKTDIALLKFQAATWGALGGMIFSGIVSVVVSMFFRLK